MHMHAGLYIYIYIYIYIYAQIHTFTDTLFPPPATTIFTLHVCCIFTLDGSLHSCSCVRGLGGQTIVYMYTCTACSHWMAVILRDCACSDVRMCLWVNFWVCISDYVCMCAGVNLWVSILDYVCCIFELYKSMFVCLCAWLNVSLCLYVCVCSLVGK
jgi:hypothetical protein